MYIFLNRNCLLPPPFNSHCTYFFFIYNSQSEKNRRTFSARGLMVGRGGSWHDNIDYPDTILGLTFRCEKFRLCGTEKEKLLIRKTGEIKNIERQQKKKDDPAPVLRRRQRRVTIRKIKGQLGGVGFASSSRARESNEARPRSRYGGKTPR